MDKPEREEQNRPVRTPLLHTPPAWVGDGASFFITVCCVQRGGDQLNRNEVFKVMADATEHYVRSERWWVDVLLAMPDHWHGIISFPQQEVMTDVMRDWKRYVARRAGVRWQDGFFDHRLRAGESSQEKWHYILQNPVRKGFCREAKDWAWVWTPEQKR